MKGWVKQDRYYCQVGITPRWISVDDALPWEGHKVVVEGIVNGRNVLPDLYIARLWNMGISPKEDKNAEWLTQHDRRVTGVKKWYPLPPTYPYVPVVEKPIGLYGLIMKIFRGRR